MNKPSYRKRKHFLAPRRVISLILVLTLFAGTLLLYKRGSINLPFLKDRRVESVPNNGINYGPPSEEEKKETQSFKEDLGNQSDTPAITPNPASNKKSVTPVISSWGQNRQTKNVEIGGYVPGILENGGTCKLTLKNSGQEITESKVANPDAQSTSCGLITIVRSRLSAGTWTATLSYISSTSEGTSQPTLLGVE